MTLEFGDVSRSAWLAGGDAAEGRVVGVESQAVAGGAAGQQAAGEAVGERGLADAVRAGDQPGVVQAAGAHRVQQRRLGGFVAEQERVGAGVGGGHRGVIARRRAVVAGRC